MKKQIYIILYCVVVSTLVYFFMYSIIDINENFFANFLGFTKEWIKIQSIIIGFLGYLLINILS